MSRKPEPKHPLPILQQDPDATPGDVARALGFRPVKTQTEIVREKPPAKYES